jgi:O-methyltransferase
MASLFIRKLLRRAGLLETVRAAKRRLKGRRVENEFKPADPRLLVSTLRCMQWLDEQGLAEGSDYLEFGIFRGFNLWYAQALGRALGIQDMRFFGFDSFFGIPAVDGVDRDGPFREGDFSAYRDEVEMFLTRYGADWGRTFLVEGFFDQSLNPETTRRHALRRCSLCVVDCDLYSSAATVLNYAESLLDDRSLLFFDDWSDYGDDAAKGEPRAFAEFLARNARVLDVEPFEDLVRLGGKGKAFIVRRRGSPHRDGADSAHQPSVASGLAGY